MGLILTTLNAAGSTLSDQWKEYFYCDAIPADTICVKGHKKTSGFGANRGNDNIISDGSVIAVADGQCLVIVEQGKVVDMYSHKLERELHLLEKQEQIKEFTSSTQRKFQV